MNVHHTQRGFVFFFSLLFSALYINAQYVFRHLDIVDGMSDNQIRGLSLLPDGRLAVRTASILNVYNGASFDHFYYEKNKEYKWDYWGLPREYCDSQNRLWMKERDYLLLLDLNTNRFIYDIEKELTTIGITSRIKNLFIDDFKNIWTVSEDSTVSYFDVAEQKSIPVVEGKSDFVRQYGIPKEMAQYKNFCWIVFSEGLIRCWDYSSKEFVFQDTHFLNIINEKTDRVYIHTTQSGNIWLMYNNAVCYFNRNDNAWTKVVTIGGLSNFFTCMDIDMDGNVWVGTSRSGLRHIDGKTLKVSDIPSMRLNSGDVLKNDIYTVFADDNNGIWVGTLFQGLCYYQPSMHKFQLVQTMPNSGFMTSENIRSFMEEDDGNVLIGTANGIYRFYPTEKKTEQVFNALSKELCMYVFQDSKHQIWVATFLNGFFCINGNNIANYKWNKSSVDQDRVYNTARYMYEDKSGRYWVSVNGGVGEFFPQSGKIKMLYESHPKVKYHKLCYEIFPVEDNSFGVVGESGIYFYNTETDSLYIPEIDNPENPRYCSNMRYYCIFTDSRKLEWQAKERGLDVWDDKNQKIYSLTIEQGLPNNTVSALLEDAEGVIWASTANGICKIQIKKDENEHYSFSIVNFGVADGLQRGRFYNQSRLKTHNGTMYFGGVHGFDYFNPQEIQYNKSTHKPIFTSFSLFNTVIRENGEYKDRIILKKPINRTDKIVLKYNENFVSLEFAGLNYVNPKQTYFRYKLENFDHEWTEILTDGSGKVTYTGLRPGTYKLVVYSANNDKLWGEAPAEITLVVKSPFWATGYALAFYIVILISLITYLLNYLEKRNNRKIEIQKEINERVQLEELNQMKFRFFTNISHEFRTPLTLITTPLDILIKDEQNEKQKSKLVSIQRNAKELLALVNQLLDFRKLEIKGERLSLSKNNIAEFVENIYLQFKDTMSGKDIGFSINNEIENPIINFDSDKIHKVINNLLSNALKFTPKGGQIDILLAETVDNNQEFVTISVEDSGCGIEEEELNSIFDRFYQSNKNKEYSLGSSGIGLHLAKEYLNMHNGKIIAASKKNEGSTFTIYIPTNLQDKSDKTKIPATEDVEDAAEETISLNNVSEKQKVILVVEDNDEFRHFLVEHLSEEYSVIEAADGDAGEKMAIEQLPDLIVSDLMMPRKDGLAMCRDLKVNIETSHIPLILLTARSSDEAKMDGYEAGADSYISKPFNFEMLLIRIKKLIEQQEKRKELYHKTIVISPSSITISSLDEELIQKGLSCVEKNIDNANYSVEELSSDLGLSRVHLYRKLQSIVGQSPIDFIRTIRLKRAAQYLVGSQYHISEIADMVGFNTIKYFNKYFKEEFGMTPTQYRSEYKEELSQEE